MGDLFLPSGILALSSILKNNGWTVDVLNVDVERITDEEVIAYIKKYNPDAIGWSAVASTAYGYIKRMTQKIKNLCVGVPIFLGGNLCSISELLLKCGIDIVFIGEAEISLVKVLERYGGEFIGKKIPDISDIKGVVYYENNEIICTGISEKMTISDSIPSLESTFDEIDINYYITDIIIPSHYGLDQNNYLDYMKSGKKMIILMIQKGCQNACTFCHRNSRYTVYAVDVVIKHIEYLKKKYNIYYFRICSESFIGKKKWILDFAAKVKDLDIIFDILGARVDKVDYEILSNLKNSGMIAIMFGYESGNQAILNQMGKNVLLEDNYKAAELCDELHIASTPQFIIGYPGETVTTLLDTKKFVKKLKKTNISCNMLQVLPGTPIYHYAYVHGYIKDEDSYLMSVSDKDAAEFDSFINMTCMHSSYIKVMRYIILKVARYSVLPRPLYFIVMLFYNLLASAYLVLKLGISISTFKYIASVLFGIDLFGVYAESINIREMMRPYAVDLKCYERIKYGYFM
ncbi:B12-binding domain-containing radical SAM protein [Chlorobium sp. BLA1]|nr:B12-binding domain-containing radical SAM protein [Candidatus Chlorobium masyuteum]